MLQACSRVALGANKIAVGATVTDGATPSGDAAGGATMGAATHAAHDCAEACHTADVSLPLPPAVGVDDGGSDGREVRYFRLHPT